MKRHRISNEFTIRINNEVVIYKDAELTMEMEWTLFSHYQLYKNYLVLLMYADFSTSMMIDQNLLTEAEAAELLAFVKARIPPIAG